MYNKRIKHHLSNIRFTTRSKCCCYATFIVQVLLLFMGSTRSIDVCTCYDTCTIDLHYQSDILQQYTMFYIGPLWRSVFVGWIPGEKFVQRNPSVVIDVVVTWVLFMMLHLVVLLIMLVLLQLLLLLLLLLLANIWCYQRVGSFCNAVWTETLYLIAACRNVTWSNY